MRSGTAGPDPRNLRSSGLGSAARKRGARRTAPESIAPSPRPSSASDRVPVLRRAVLRRAPWPLLPCSEAARPPAPALLWMPLRSPAALLWGPPSFVRNRLSSPLRPSAGVPAAAAIRLAPGARSSLARRLSQGRARPAAGLPPALPSEPRPAPGTCPLPAQPAPPVVRTPAKEAFPPAWAARLWPRIPYLRPAASDSRNSRRRRGRPAAQRPR